jgi:hypothetical protein
MRAADREVAALRRPLARGRVEGAPAVDVRHHELQNVEVAALRKHGR